MDKYKAPKIHPLLINNKFIINCKEKAVEFASFFGSQCKPILNDCTFPNITYLTNKRLHHIPFTNEKVLLLICSLLACYVYVTMLLSYP